MSVYRLWMADGIVVSAVIAGLALVDIQADPDPEHLSRGERQAERLIEAEADLREARRVLPECAVECLTPSEAVAIAFSAGPDRRVNGRFILDIKGGGASGPGAPESLFFLNSQKNYRLFGSLTLAVEPEAMRHLLNPPRVKLGDNLQDGDIIVERERPRKRVSLSVSNMLDRFENRRVLIDGDVGLQWIRIFGTKGREGVRREGYYQVWVRVASPGQVTIVSDDKAN